jgi:hypothetical protein
VVETNHYCQQTECHSQLVTLNNNQTVRRTEVLTLAGCWLRFGFGLLVVVFVFNCRSSIADLPDPVASGPRQM